MHEFDPSADTPDWRSVTLGLKETVDEFTSALESVLDQPGSDIPIEIEAHLRVYLADLQQLPGMFSSFPQALN